MILENVELAGLYPALRPAEGTARLRVYAHTNSPEIDMKRRYPSILICPGGAYAFVSDREAEPVAVRYFNAGYNAFVLTYSVAPLRYPEALLEAAAAMDHIGKNADRYNCSGKTAVIGFSAGGHLAANLGCFWDRGFIAEALGSESAAFRPDAMILGYPVITSGEKSHRGSFVNLCGDDEELMKSLSLENAVGENTPPAFIWHTFDDGGVPVENSLLLAAAMKKAGRPFELHIFREGCHGLSLCGYETAGPGQPALINPAAAEWFPLSLTWLKAVLA